MPSLIDLLLVYNKSKLAQMMNEIFEKVENSVRKAEDLLSAFPQCF